MGRQPTARNRAKSHWYCWKSRSKAKKIKTKKTQTHKQTPCTPKIPQQYKEKCTKIQGEIGNTLLLKTYSRYMAEFSNSLTDEEKVSMLRRSHPLTLVRKSYLMEFGLETLLAPPSVYHEVTKYSNLLQEERQGHERNGLYDGNIQELIKVEGGSGTVRKSLAPKLTKDKITMTQHWKSMWYTKGFLPRTKPKPSPCNRLD